MLGDILRRHRAGVESTGGSRCNVHDFYRPATIIANWHFSFVLHGLARKKIARSGYAGDSRPNHGCFTTWHLLFILPTADSRPAIWWKGQSETSMSLNRRTVSIVSGIVRRISQLCLPLPRGLLLTPFNVEIVFPAVHWVFDGRCSCWQAPIM